MIDFSGVELKLGRTGGRTTVFDPVRRKWVALTPEEHVRQYVLYYMINVVHYPTGMLSVEKAIMVGNRTKRFDIVVYNREHKPWMLVECKAPEVPISQKTLEQLLSYQRSVQCSYWLLTNGHQTYCADACDVSDIKWLESLPVYNL